jgi:hypothetical protein
LKPGGHQDYRCTTEAEDGAGLNVIQFAQKTRPRPTTEERRSAGTGVSGRFSKPGGCLFNPTVRLLEALV